MFVWKYILLLLPMDIFTGFMILDWQLFSFSTLKISQLLVSIVTAKKLAGIPTVIALKIIFFYCNYFKDFLYVFVFLYFNIMCLGEIFFFFFTLVQYVGLLDSGFIYFIGSQNFLLFKFCFCSILFSISWMPVTLIFPFWRGSLLFFSWM